MIGVVVGDIISSASTGRFLFAAEGGDPDLLLVRTNAGDVRVFFCIGLIV